MPENNQGRLIQYRRSGYASDADANAASARVASVIDEIVSELELSLAGLDGVTIAFDYDSALAQLDRGFDSSSSLTRTKDDIGEGCAMAPLVMRNGCVMTHLVLSAFIVPLIDAPQSGVSGKYIIAHELSHVHENFFRNRALPNTLLALKIVQPDEAFLFEVADACWGEYVACYLSASVHPEQGKLYEVTLVDLLEKAKNEILGAKKKWMNDHDFADAWRRVGGTVASLLKYFSYLLGHARGLDKQITDVAPKASQLLESNTWLAPWVSKLNDVLSNMLKTFETWNSVEVFEPLKAVARGLLEDCGVKISDANGSLYVFIDNGKLPTW